MSEKKGVRNLWAEVRSSDAEDKRRLIEAGGRILYTAIIIIGGLLALDLYTRPESQVIKIFGVAAAVILVVSDSFWAWATHHSAAGAQRLVARVFWGLGVLIYALNVIAEYAHYLNVQMSDVVAMWYWSASVVTVVEAAVGWALYLMCSPEQKLADVAAKAKADAIKGLMKGIETPDATTAQAFNEQVQEASRDLADYAAGVVKAHVGGLVYKSSNGKSAESTFSKNFDVEPPETNRPNAQ